MEATDRGLAAHLAAELPPAVRRVAAWTAAERADAAERCADVIASGGDALWARDRASRDGGRRAGELHDGLVTGLAVLAHRHGGVRFAGMEWDAALPGCAAALLPGAWSVPAPTISREDRGAVFTPREIADDVVSNALGVLVADRQASGALEIESLRVAVSPAVVAPSWSRPRATSATSWLAPGRTIRRTRPPPSAGTAPPSPRPPHGPSSSSTASTASTSTRCRSSSPASRCSCCPDPPAARRPASRPARRRCARGRRA